MPKLKYVNWNTGDASAASAALKHAAGELERTAHERARAARVATATWQGAYRESFDPYLSWAVQGARDLAQMYRRAAATIEADNGKAQELNRKREREHEEKEKRRRTP